MPQVSPKTSVAILGATGSIGMAAVGVVQSLGENWTVFGISAHKQLTEAVQIAQQIRPKYLVATCLEAARQFDFGGLPSEVQLLRGAEGMVQLAESPEVDTVVASVVGSAGLMSSLAAAKAGKRLALANKETLVVAGSLVTESIKQSGGELIPVDSEHSAIFQTLRAGNAKEVSRIILTASGGPFRTWPADKLLNVTVEDALAHPTWQMGRKISIDSATMMNKALEVIEARWLFDLPASKIQVVVHPQSIIHSMVEFIDGSVIAQLSPPDMRLPIQYALTYPDRNQCPCPKMDWTTSQRLELEPVDLDRFPALNLGWEVADRGGSSGAVLNAANEAAVELFLQGKIRFVDIVASCRAVLNEHHFEPSAPLEQLLQLDRWARQEIRRWAAC